MAVKENSDTEVVRPREQGGPGVRKAPLFISHVAVVLPFVCWLSFFLFCFFLLSPPLLPLYVGLAKQKCPPPPLPWFSACGLMLPPISAQEPPSSAKSRMRKAVRWLPKWPSLGRAAHSPETGPDRGFSHQESLVVCCVCVGVVWCVLMVCVVC